MQHKIIPHLWFDTQAREAAEVYIHAFSSAAPESGESAITHSTVLHDTPSGDAETVSFTLAGQPFMAISAGPYFKINPSISFFICCDTEQEVDKFWSIFTEGGKALMELGAYPFSSHYGWVQDRFGVSWQIMYMGGQKYEQKIIPNLMFTGANAGKTEEAITFYTSVFHNAKTNFISRYGAGMEPDKEGTVNHAGFILEGLQFAAMDSAHKHEFNFNEAVSLIVRCDTQDEIDYYWDRLSAVPESEQCGWLKDKYGVSWQIVPRVMDEMMSKGTPEQIARVTQAFMPMKKFDIAALEHAYKG